MQLLVKIIGTCWLLSEVYLSIFKRSKKKNSKIRIKHSLAILWIVMATSFAAGRLITIYFEYPIANSSILTVIGLLILVSGVIIRYSSIWTLGQFFTHNLVIHDDHTLVRKGFYKYIRHPSYTGALMAFLGLGISWNNWLGAGIMFIPILIVFLYRIKIEENMLSEQFGSEYLEYKKRTKRLIPEIY